MAVEIAEDGVDEVTVLVPPDLEKDILAYYEAWKVGREWFGGAGVPVLVLVLVRLLPMCDAVMTTLSTLTTTTSATATVVL